MIRRKSPFRMTHTSRVTLTLAITSSLCAGAMLALAPVAGLAQPAATAQSQLEVLRTQFAQPPAEARPWTWYHVMSGNMTREGITKDLESLAEVGVGGIVLFHVAQGISFGPVKFNSPEHLELIAHAAAECERLGLKFNFHNSDGWSSSGGPSVTPEQSMKRVVWSEALVNGGDVVDLRLQAPPVREGFYRDIAVLAYPALAGEIADASVPVRITSSDSTLNIARLTDGNEDTTAPLAVAGDNAGWVQFSYDQPVTIRNVRLGNMRIRDTDNTLEVSDDGVTFRKVSDLAKIRMLRDQWDVDVALDPLTARHFRITFSRFADLGEIALSQLARIDSAAGQTALAHVFGKDLKQAGAVPGDAVIDPDSVIDLSAMVTPDGHLRASLPEGDWTVLRFGYTSTGALNVNPSPEGEGLEVDKFDASAFRAYHEAFIKPWIDIARKAGPNAINGVMIDSYEVGGQNWTDGYEQLFAQRYGEDLTRWLPLFAGRFVDSAPATAAMLARIRDFNVSLMHQNYYQEFADLMAAENLDSFVQPYGYGPFDEVTVASIASVPAGEFWVRRNDLVRLNSSVSAARLYDKPVVAAEAFTAIWDDNWNFSPAFGKRWGDNAWVNGVNLFFFHRFAHQANTHVMPGMTMNRWGSHFDRTQPWWDEGGKAWFTYMARGQYMLRQGKGVADVAMLVGSQSPVECPEKNTAQDRLPAGVEFDCVDSASLLERGRFEGGAFVMPNGARYQMIWWPHEAAPNAAELARIEQARAAGVPVAMANRGDDAAAIFAAAGLSPRVLATGDLPGFTQRKMGDMDIVFARNDTEEERHYDLCWRMGGKAAELWNPVTGATTAIAGTLQADGCSQIALTMAPYESQFLVFSKAARFLADDGLAPSADHVLATVNDGWTLSFDPFYGEAGTLENVTLFDWSSSQNPEIRNYSGKATYRNSVTLAADDVASGKPIRLALGNVASVATVRVNGSVLGTVWTAPYAIDISSAVQAGSNSIEIEVANLWVNRLIGDAALPDTSGYIPESNLGYRPIDNLPLRNMVDWYVANQPPPPGPRRTWATQYFQKADDPLLPSGLIGPVQLLKDPK